MPLHAPRLPLAVQRQFEEDRQVKSGRHGFAPHEPLRHQNATVRRMPQRCDDFQSTLGCCAKPQIDPTITLYGSETIHRCKVPIALSRVVSFTLSATFKSRSRSRSGDQAAVPASVQGSVPRPPSSPLWFSLSLSSWRGPSVQRSSMRRPPPLGRRSRSPQTSP
jgi:hypothetical protein